MEYSIKLKRVGVGKSFIINTLLKAGSLYGNHTRNKKDVYVLKKRCNIIAKAALLQQII